MQTVCHTASAATAPQSSRTTTQPTREHVALYRSQCRLAPDESLHAWQADAAWRVRLAEVDDGWPDEINELSRVDALALMAAARDELRWRATHGLTNPQTAYGWPRDFLDTLKARVPIDAEIGLSVPLAPRGARFVGPCPLHRDDRTPSLTVYPAQGSWYCFGCHNGGDVLAWVQAFNRALDFPGAVSYLAARAGVALPERGARRPALRVRAVDRG